MIGDFYFPSIADKDLKGLLRVFELTDIPFSVKRVFTVLNSAVGTVRGKHAHKLCNQLICCVAGSIKLTCDDGQKTQEMELTPMSPGVLVPAGVWAEQLCLEQTSVIVVFCDQHYDEDDYLRDYSQFLDFTKGAKNVRRSL